MEIVKIEKVRQAIDGYMIMLNEHQAERNQLIANNADAINKKIEEKLALIADEIQTSATREVCGEALDKIDSGIAYIENNIKLLEGLIETVEEPVAKPAEEKKEEPVETLEENIEGLAEATTEGKEE